MDQALDSDAVARAALAQSDQFPPAHQHLARADPGETDELRPHARHHAAPVDRCGRTARPTRPTGGRDRCLPMPAGPHHGPADVVGMSRDGSVRDHQIDPDDRVGPDRYSTTTRPPAHDVESSPPAGIGVDELRSLTRPEHDRAVDRLAPPHRRPGRTAVDERIEACNSATLPRRCTIAAAATGSRYRGRRTDRSTSRRSAGARKAGARISWRWQGTASRLRAPAAHRARPTPTSAAPGTAGAAASRPRPACDRAWPCCTGDTPRRGCPSHGDRRVSGARRGRSSRLAPRSIDTGTRHGRTRRDRETVRHGAHGAFTM